MRKTMLVLGLAAASGSASAQFANFDNETEGFKGPSFSSGGLTFYSVNNNSGVNPDGSNFNPGDYGQEVIIENATLAYNDFPSVLSPFNALSFGSSFVPGDSLTINLVSEVYITNNASATAASLDLVHYENGPWGGLMVHLDALDRGSVVATDSFTISDLGGRDNPIGSHLSVSGATFDTVRLHVTMPDGTPSVFASIVDNVNFVPAPASSMLLVGGAMALRRRR